MDTRDERGRHIRAIVSPLGHRITPPRPGRRTTLAWPGRYRFARQPSVASVHPVRPQTIACPLRAETDSHLRRFYAPAITHAVAVHHQPLAELSQDHILAHVDVARTVHRPRPRAGEAVTASISGPAVHPVRVQPPPAQPAAQQPHQCILARYAVVVRPCRPHALRGNEVRLAHQRRMREHPRHRPRRARVSGPAPRSRRDERRSFGSTPDGRCSGGCPGSSRSCATTTIRRCGAHSGPGPPQTDTAHHARSTPARYSPRCARTAAARTSTAHAAR